MAIYKMTQTAIDKVATTSFASQGLKERADLQRLLRKQIEVIAPHTMVLAEEFGDWDGANRRIDLLALDRQNPDEARLVVIELKRTDDGGHMELQALRYAAMVSVMTFNDAVTAHAGYLSKIGETTDARESILSFLSWQQPQEFAKEVRILLVAADFSREILTTVVWLNSQSLDIRCVRLQPYQLGDATLLDVQQVLPLPEAADFQIRIREKQVAEEAAKHVRDYTRYDIVFGGKTYAGLRKNKTLLEAVKVVVGAGVSPDLVWQATCPTWGAMFRSVEGLVSAEQFLLEVAGKFDANRYFCDEPDLLRHGQQTWALNSNWGGELDSTLTKLLLAYPVAGFQWQRSVGVG